MNTIKRVFLINDIPTNLKTKKSEEIFVGYFENHKNNIEVKQIIEFKNNRKYKTHLIKQNKKKGLIQQSNYKKISEKSFQDYRHFAQQNHVHKIKYSLIQKKQTINIYRFLGDLDGLWIADVMFQTDKDKDSFISPARCYTEITTQKGHEDLFLAIKGMNNLVKKNNYQSILTNFQLKSFYNKEAKKYSQTRKKHRGDAEQILNAIQTHHKTSIKILEIGCGSGRLLGKLNSIKHKNIEYVGVDISENIIHEAKKTKTSDNIKKSFICQNMINYLKDSKQEQFDIVIGIASLQHLADKKQRYLAIKHIYKTLEYEGLFIMTNRSFSIWFLKKYRQSILTNLISKLINHKSTDRNSLKIAWKTQNKIYYRFYHIFTLKEIHKTLSQAGFITQKIGYLNKKGEETLSRKNSSNSIAIAKKTVFSH